MANRSIGILISSHVPALAEGVATLLKGSAPDVSITHAGGTDDGDIGASFEKILAAAEANEGLEIFAFYDLGSAMMTLQLVQEMSEKQIHIMDVALVEGAFTVAALAQGEVSIDVILEQLEPLKIKAND